MTPLCRTASKRALPQDLVNAVRAYRRQCAHIQRLARRLLVRHHAGQPVPLRLRAVQAAAAARQMISPRRTTRCLCPATWPCRRRRGSGYRCRRCRRGIAGGTGDSRRVRAGAEVQPHARAAVLVAGHRSRYNVQDQAVAAERHKSNDERATLKLTWSCMVLCVHPLTSATLEPTSCMLLCVRLVAELQLVAPVREVPCLGPALPSTPRARCAP